MNVLVNVRKETWARVKYYATTQGLTLSDAVDAMLNMAFSKEVLNQEVQK